MKKKIIDQIKSLFGNGFRKKLKQTETYEELKKELRKKAAKLEDRLKHTKSKSEKKLIAKKLEVLQAQLIKIDEKLSE